MYVYVNTDFNVKSIPFVYILNGFGLRTPFLKLIAHPFISVIACIYVGVRRKYTLSSLRHTIRDTSFLESSPAVHHHI